MTAINNTTEVAVQTTANVISIDELLKKQKELDAALAANRELLKKAAREQAERERQAAADRAAADEAKRGQVMANIVESFAQRSAILLAEVCAENGMEVNLNELASFMHANREKKQVKRLTDEQIALIKNMFMKGIPAMVIADAMEGIASYATIVAHGEKVEHGVITVVGPEGKTWQTGKRGAIPDFAREEITNVMRDNFPELNIQRASTTTA